MRPLTVSLPDNNLLPNPWPFEVYEVYPVEPVRKPVKVITNGRKPKFGSGQKQANTRRRKDERVAALNWRWSKKGREGNSKRG